MAEEEKVQLAIYFADVCSSTQLFEKYGDDKAREIISHALSLLGDITDRHGGTVVKTIGDEVMGTFPDLPPAISAVNKMPEAILSDSTLSKIGLQIRVGMHYGDVIREADGDVYGDAVNIAARLVDWARPDQVITNGASLEQLPDFMQPNLRNLGSSTVRGKEEPMEMIELLGEQSDTNLTKVGGRPDPIEEVETNTRLVLRHDGRKVSIERGELTLGRSSQSDLRVDDSQVSRLHARIEYRNGNYVLIDASTNGTHVQIGDADVVFLHRDQLHLHGTGAISLGRRIDSEQARPLRFEVHD
jgi:class 3 adenylate cyclase